MVAPRYCSNCGKPLGSTANFCASCGKSVQKRTAPLSARPTQAPANPVQAAQSTPALQPAAAAQAAPGMPQEAVVGAIGGAVCRSGLLGLKGEAFVIVLTNLRVIFAAQTTQMMKENVVRVRDSAKQEGKGFFGQWGAQFGANSGKHYLQMDPQTILQEQPDNFFYYTNQLRSIRMREEYDDESSMSTYYMEFDTLGGKHKFQFSNLDTNAVKKLLQQMYGKIMR